MYLRIIKKRQGETRKGVDIQKEEEIMYAVIKNVTGGVEKTT